MTLPGLTQRAAEALKPFVDAALTLEREGFLNVGLPTKETSVRIDLAVWRELLAALRESQLVAEGIK